MVADLAKIEDRIDKTATASMEIATAQVGGIRYESASECMEAAKMLATAGVMVPPHLRQQPGTCLAVIMQALEWGLPVMAVANKSYVVNNKGVERVAYESQLIHALVEKRAPLKGRLRHQIIGEGDERRCKVWGTFEGETEPHTYTSATLGESLKRIGKNDYGKIKGSPLWESKPELQMFYDATRDWARMHCPDVLLGAYAPEEFPDAVPVDVTPAVENTITGLAARLKDQRREHVRPGFDADHVHRETEAHRGNRIIEHDAIAENEVGEESKAEAGSDAAGHGDDQVRERGSDGDSGPDDANAGGDADRQDRPAQAGAADQPGKTEAGKPKGRAKK